MFLETLGIDDQIFERLLTEALAHGADYADLFFAQMEGGVIQMEEDLIKSAGRQTFRGGGIRVIKGEQTGYAYTEDLSLECLEKAARTAAAISRAGGGPKTMPITPLAVESRYSVEQPVSEAAVEQRMAFIRKAQAASRAHERRVRQVNCSLADSICQVVVVTSEGHRLEDSRPMLRFSVDAVAEAKGNLQQGRSGGGGRLGLEYFSRICSAEDHGIKAAEQAVLLLDARDAPAGPMTVILAPGDSGILLHEAIGHPLEADFNRKGTSAYADRIGEQVASPLVTVVDDATVPHDRGSINFDDEGVPGQATMLIDKGILRGYMHDRISARYFGVEPTGNGRRESYKYHPIPRMTTTYLQAGSHDPEEIVGSTEKGIYCKTFRGGQVDISNGDFVFVPSEAYLVEKGRITAPIKNLTLIGNGPDVLTRVTMVGHDARMSDGMWTCGKGQSVPVGVGLPTVKVSEITVGGSSI